MGKVSSRELRKNEDALSPTCPTCRQPFCKLISLPEQNDERDDTERDDHEVTSRSGSIEASDIEAQPITTDAAEILTEGSSRLQEGAESEEGSPQRQQQNNTIWVSI